MGGVGVGGMGGIILYYYLAGRASEIEGKEYLIARKDKCDKFVLWKDFLEKMEYGRAKRVLRWSNFWWWSRSSGYWSD
jgi:hypothetical protein